VELFEFIDERRVIKEKFTAIEGYEHIKRTWNREFQLYAANVVPGEFYITEQDECIKTTLGSCIACCVRDPENGIGGLNHFMLPEFNSTKRNLKDTSQLGKEGCWAMEFLINGVLLHGGERSNLEVKLFGGAQLIAGLEGAQVGQKNINFIDDYVNKESLNVAARDLGGQYARTIIFFPKTGKVKLNRLGHNQDKKVLREEQSYAGRVNSTPDSCGDIELF